MIEQGLYLLIQNTPAIKSICVQGGGYMDQLPPGWDEVTPSWSWTRVSERPWYGLQFQPGLITLMYQIDCYGLGATNITGTGPMGADCIALAYAIDKVLSGAGGGLALPDPDQTKLDSVFRTDRKTFFDSAGRTYRVMLEYRVNYFYSGGSASPP